MMGCCTVSTYNLLTATHEQLEAVGSVSFPVAQVSSKRNGISNFIPYTILFVMEN